MPTILENLRKAYEIVAATPEETVCLDTFRRETPCGTLFCTAGLLAQDPFFKKQGFRLLSADNSYYLNVDDEKADRLFGESAFDVLFETYGDGLDDNEFLSEESAGDERPTHKELALLRLRKQIADVESGR